MRRPGERRSALRAAVAAACWLLAAFDAVATEAPVTSTSPPPVSPAPAKPPSEAAAKPAPVTATEWAVVVHPANPVRTMKRGDLERIYRRRTRYWPEGHAILPLNLPSGDPLRRSFSEDILHDDEEALATFWNREYFQGIAPPVVLRSSRAVRAYVATTPTAIGYVRREDLDASVAEVEVTRGD